MSKFIAAFFLHCSIALSFYPAAAQTPEIDLLLAQADELMWQESYAEAYTAAGKALSIAEHEFGKNDLRLVKSLGALAMLNVFQDQFAEAEKQYKRILEILNRWPEGSKAEISEAEAKLKEVAQERKEHEKAEKEERKSRRKGWHSSKVSGGTGYGWGRRWSWHSGARGHFGRDASSGRQGLAFRSQILPAFPWPPPAASAIYVIPRDIFRRNSTIGEVSSAIIAALERSGYTERSFYQTSGGGIAMVTRLERINEDGAPADSSLRWPTDFKTQSASLIDFLQGLFYASDGYYRVIVFILRDLPFRQSSKTLSPEEAQSLLREGANTLPRELAGLPFRKDSTCTAVIYEFLSSKNEVEKVQSPVSARQHLEKAGILAALN
jgi:Tetratricopeptide repeat